MRLSGALPPVVLAFLFTIAGGLPSVAPTTAAEILQLNAATELKAGQNGHFIVKAEINGTRIKVLVDTGASAVALSYEDASDVGLHPKNLDFNVPVSTANGMTKAAGVSLEKVEINGVRVSDVQGLVMPEGVMRGSLLGMSFLSKLKSFKVEDGVLYLKN
ncbi:MAG TPA: TIGR02281 family clan AA aspartic protease [Aestuariivirga sp.]|nr:TIGR02281 family clan AA aspartic protease [Aestuariivirga sp.]